MGWEGSTGLSRHLAKDLEHCSHRLEAKKRNQSRAGRVKTGEEGAKYEGKWKERGCGKRIGVKGRDERWSVGRRQATRHAVSLEGNTDSEETKMQRNQGQGSRKLFLRAW